MTPRFAYALAVVAWTFAGSAVAESTDRISSMPPVDGSLYGQASQGAVFVSRFAPLTHRGESVRGDVVSLGFTTGARGGQLRFGTTWAAQEQRFDVGLAGEDFAVNLFTGRGESYSRLDPDSLQVDPYFFHGGSREAFDYRGAAAELAVARAVNLQFAMADIDARHLDTRRAAYAGFTAGRAAAGVFSVSRRDDATAGGMILSWSGRAGAARLRQIEHESGARYRSLGYSRTTDRGHRFSVSLRSGRNPLYRDGDESRVMFRLSGRLGAPPPDALSAAETVANGEPAEDGSDGEATSGRGRALAILGGGLVAVGVAASSGSDDKDEVIRIRGRDNAARQVFNRINPESVRQNREHGGWIYGNADGTYGYTQPVAGTLASVDIGPRTVVPGGTVPSATYHTHGGPDPRFDNENFSPSDLLSDRIQRVDGYLGTPGGFMKRHDFRSGEITALGRINN